MSASMNPNPRVLIVGAGGIGGVLGTRLLQASVPLSLATTNEAVRHVWLGEGPSLNERAVGRALPKERLLSHASEADDPFDVVFIAVQPPQIDEVCHSLRGRLTERGRIVCLSNGLCEERIAKHWGPERVVGAVVAWGARMPTPGHYLQTSSGGFRVGTFSGESEPELEIIARLLENVGPVVFTDNLRGARFSKLALNCAVSTLGTIAGHTLGKILVRKDAREIALAILREAIAVARAEGIRLEPVTRLDLKWLDTEDHDVSAPRRALQHALLLGVGLRYRRLRSSMLAAMERGRSPAVDFLNGELVERGERLGVPTPMNRAAQTVVWDIAHGQRTAGLDTLHTLLQLGTPAA